MSFDENTVPPDEAPDPVTDPLGIVGWVIGGKYKIRAHIGGGGFGEVYEGFNVNLTEQRVVVKFFKRVQAREKFDKEAKILCQLDHPNISRVIDYLPDEGAVVVAFIDGKDANVRLKDSGPFGEALFLIVARSITSAITYAHSKKIAHRDMKPANIIIDKNDIAYLIDFGIAKEIGGDATKTAYQALTPMIAAPERQQGDQDYNPFLSDIYETGITLFNLATNSLPYRNPINPDINEWGGPAAQKLSPELRRILIKATHPDPKSRYLTAGAMCDDLASLEKAYGGGKKRSSGLILTAVMVIGIGLLGWQFGGDLWNKIMTAAVTSSLDQQTTGETSPTSPEQGEGEEVDGTAVSEDKALESGSGQDKAKGTDANATAKKNSVDLKKANNTSKPASIDNQIKAEAKKPTVIKKTVTPKKPTPSTDSQTKPSTPPPPKIKSNLIVNVTPDNITKMIIGGQSRQPGKRFEISTGPHNLLISHPDFPVYHSRLRADEGSDSWAVDLEPTRPSDTVTLQLALIPPSEKYFLELSFNGRVQKISRFPVLDLPHPVGEWDVTLTVKNKLTPSDDAAIVDSCVIIPSSPALRQILGGASGLLKFEAGGNLRSRMLIYWKEKK